ncbi:hypothetical protein [Teredinibacter waterburyi]|jgi:hypothetical protein|uniref:hypothetical protein n=1 Tax=Teredinibacter waterburyi TaxID=1500538 RepID=UPI00165F1C50|nr:hypothetical protein [Teredinibacter waterburyi]
MKPLKTKAQIRDEIAQQVASYIADGGDVRDVPRGLSGNINNSNLFSASTSFEPKHERTPLNDVIQQLDERKRNSKLHPPKRHRQPTKKLITDDFGEPLRWVWKDE